MPVSSLPIASPARPALPQLPSSCFDHPTAFACPSNLPAAPVVGIPSPVAPAVRKVVPTTAGQHKRKTRVRMNRVEEEKWRTTRCNAGPLGSCHAPQEHESIFCKFHSCTAINADGTTCGNFVPNPDESRICRDGYHMENGAYSMVRDLLAARKEHNRKQEMDRLDVHAHHSAFFDHHFGEPSRTRQRPLITSPSPVVQRLPPTTTSTMTNGTTECSAWSSDSSRSSVSSRASVDKTMTPNGTPGIHMSPVIRRTSGSTSGSTGPIVSGGSEDRPWGSYSVDKWWVGQWAIKTRPVFLPYFPASTS